MLIPRFGCGSRGVKVANNYQELVNACEFCKKDFSPIEDKDILVEELIIGNEYSCNFFVLDNQVKIYLLPKKNMTELPFRQEISYADFYLTNDEIDFIYDYVRKC